jgi:hypothetical protein
MMDKAVMVFPEPVSPMRAKLLPFSIQKEISSVITEG